MSTFLRNLMNLLSIAPFRKTKLAAILCFSLFLVNKASATTYPVNTYASLTAAVSSAVDGDIISVTANIVVTAEVAISKTLTFNGNNYIICVPTYGVTDEGLLASSASAFRVFNISASGKTIVFNNLTIKGGNPTTPGGAVTIASGSIVKFNSCTISNSQATSGGGISNSGTCYLSKSRITRNAASYGGGFVNSSGTMFIEYSNISENRSLSASGGGGGCENNGTANMYINNSSFGNNQSTELGGAINNNGSANAYIFNTSFTGNVAYGSYKGGAIAQNESGRTMYLVNCLFGYNYYNTSGGTAAFTMDDVHAYAGTINLYYCTYMASSVASGTVTQVVGNNVHTLAADGSTNDLFTGGSLGPITDANGNLYAGAFNVYRPFLVNISGSKVPTLKTGSYAIGKGCITGFTNGGGTPAAAYKNSGTWTNIIGTTGSSYTVTDDETNYTRPATPAAGALDKIVDNYVILKVGAASNGSVNGASIYGDVYPSGTSVTIFGIPNAGYALTNWTYNLGGTGVVAGNPLTLTLTQSTTLTPNFLVSTTYSMTYIGNSNTSGTPPAISSYLIGSNGTAATNSGSLAKTGFSFAGWNTADNGSGTDYAPGATYSGSNVVLYAKWTSLGYLLDVHLADFTATPADGGKSVLLNWQTSAENNSSYFELQRSSDCSNSWDYVARINAAGNSSVTSYYSYTDNQPPSGTFCYRLKEVDKDGKAVYLPAVTVRLNSNLSAAINIFPNPSKNIVYLTGDKINGAARITLLDNLGQNVTRLCTINQQTDKKYSIDISRLTPGIYLIKTSAGINRFTVQ